MNANIAKAQELARWGEAASHPEAALVLLSGAQAHATIAVAEELRLANLLKMVKLEVDIAVPDRLIDPNYRDIYAELRGLMGVTQRK